MKEPSFGVIIPVYNGEDFIGECLDSVQGQSYPVAEIIIVDDGSTDGTPEILKKYEESANIRVIRQDNAGQGAARNRALRQLSSQYVMFVDADDKTVPRLFQEVARRLASHPNADVIHFNWQYFSYDESGKEIHSVRNHDAVLSKGILQGDECDQLLTITNYFSINNVFRRDFLASESIRFGEGMIYEDNAMMVKAITRAEVILLIDEALYFYRKENESSSSRSGHASDRHYRDAVKAIHDAVGSLRPRTTYSRYYLFNYYVQKLVVYYERRIPRAYRRSFIREMVDNLHELKVDACPPDASKLSKLFVRWKLVSKKRYALIWLLVSYKVMLSKLTRAQK